MRNEKIQELTLTSMFAAIIAIMALVPYLGFIPNPLVPGASLTIIHIIVIIGGIVLGRQKSWVLGTFFGIMSLILAFLRPSGPIDIIFRNPLVSVLPRVIFGIVIYEIYNLLNKIIKNRVINISITMFVSTFIHTILVVLMLYIFGKGTLIYEGLATEESVKNVIIFFSTFFLVSGLLEAGIAVVIGTPITTALLIYEERNN